MRVAVAATFLVLLSGCGPGSPSSAPPAQAGAASRPSQPRPDAAAMQARVAALAAPYNQADYEAGRRAFGACRSCHTLARGGPNTLGPNLHGVFGRAAGSLASFEYSTALRAAGFNWDGDHLNGWLADPRGYLPGNRMAFAGLRNETQRRDLIAYLMVESAPGAE